MMRKGVAVTAAILAMSVGIISPAISYADKLSDAQNRLSTLEHNRTTTQSHIKQLQQQEFSLQGQISAIESKVGTLDKSIMLTQANIVQRNVEIARLQNELAATQKKLNTQYVVLQQRIRVMYEAGQTSYLDVLFSATSFTDLIDRMQMLSMVAQQDKDVLNGIQTTKTELETTNQKLNTQLAGIKKVYTSLLTQKTQQQNAQNQEQSLLQRVHNTKLSEQADLKSENSAMAGLQSLIQQLQSQQGGYNGPASGWTWPVPGHHYISSGYGWRTWSDGTREFHNGIDIPAPIGTPMVSVTNGKVLYAGPASGFGDWIVIESAGGLLEVYGHMYAYEIKVHPGQIVKEGQQIASVGSNGFSTGPHLHITIATGFDSAGYPISVDPMKYI